MDISADDFLRDSEGSYAVIRLAATNSTVRIVAEERDKPTSLQIDAANEIVKKLPGILRKIEKPLLAFYRATSAEADGCGPEIQSEAEVLSHIQIDSIEIPAIAESNLRYARIHGSCTWEREHGLEIQVKNGSEILYVGPHEQHGLSDPPTDAPMNYALPENLEAGLNCVPFSEEELEQLALDNVDTSTRFESEPEETKPKAWWRLW